MVDRSRIPNDHPLRSILTKVDVKRTRNELDDIFEFNSSPLKREDVDVSRGPRGVQVEPDGFLEDEEFDAFTNAARESDVLRFDSMDNSNFVVESNLDTPDPWDVHSERDRDTALADSNRKAKVTTDPVKYANEPERYDFPFVDTPQEFRNEFENSSFATRGFDMFEEKAGPDDIFDY